MPAHRPSTAFRFFLFLLAHAGGQVGEIASFSFGKLVESALLRYFAVGNNSNPIALLNSGEPMRNYDRGSSNHAFTQSVLHLALGFLIKCTCCFIQQ
jgi:hypothetical protein